MQEYSEWIKNIGDEIKKYPLIKNTWKIPQFDKMYKEGLSWKEAFRCWICSH